MLRLERIAAGYGPIDVVRGLDMTIGEGSAVALLGPNGAGKSTLLAALTGTIRRRSGRALLRDRDLMRLPSHAIVAAGVALVPEGRQIFEPLTVRDNLRLDAIRLGRDGGHSLAERFDFVFELFPRLKERHKQVAGTLSGGERQMVAVARALMSAPRLLLLDEPFLGLAPMVVIEISDAIATLRAEAGLTILLVEQKLDIALDICERASVMIKGELVLTESADTLRKRRDLNDLYFALATRQSKAETDR